MAQFEKLFEPITIKSMTMSNRIIMPALTVNIANGPVNDAAIAYYERRAVGGAGLIVVGISGVIPNLVQGLDLASDDRIEGHKRMVKAIHKHGSKASIQLWHPGRYELTFLTKRQAVSASDVAPPIFSREKPRPLKVEEIKDIVKAFADAAARAGKAGYDSVEFIASAGYLIAQFMSPLTNLRSDEYGGGIENRARVGKEIVAAARAKLGDDFPIWIRMVGDELIPGGNTIEEMKKFAAIWEKAGVDAFNVTAGWHESRIPMLTMNVPRGGYVWMAEGIKSALKHAPVAASNRLNDPELAEKVLREGRADMVSLGRPLVCDPDLPNKVKHGKSHLVRRCIACMNCLDSLFTGARAYCALNPEACRESEVGELKPAPAKKKVVVIGGGPAGCEAARTARLRGHDVVLFEKEKTLGGQLNLASQTPDFGEFALLVKYYEAQLEDLGVEVKLGKEATYEMIAAEKPDVVIYAAGAVPSKPPIPGVNSDNVIDAWDVLRGMKIKGKDVAVIGGGGTGCDVAMHLAHQKKSVTQLEMLPKIGHNIGPGSKWVVLQTLKELGVKSIANFKVTEIKPGEVLGEVNGDKKTIKADMVVLAIGSKPRRELYDKIKAGNMPVLGVGDAIEPRKILNAVHDGYNIAREI